MTTNESRTFPPGRLSGPYPHRLPGGGYPRLASVARARPDPGLPRPPVRPPGTVAPALARRRSAASPAPAHRLPAPDLRAPPSRPPVRPRPAHPHVPPHDESCHAPAPPARRCHAIRRPIRSHYPNRTPVRTPLPRARPATRLRLKPPRTPKHNRGTASQLLRTQNKLRDSAQTQTLPASLSHLTLLPTRSPLYRAFTSRRPWLACGTPRFSDICECTHRQTAPSRANTIVARPGRSKCLPSG